MKLPLPLKTFTKVVTVVCCILMISLSVYQFFRNNVGDIKELSLFITAIDSIILAIVLFLSEFDIKWILDGFGLIANLLGRGVYLFFCGSLYLGLKDTLGYAVGGICMGCGVIYMLSYCCSDEAKQMNQNDDNSTSVNTA